MVDWILDKIDIIIARLAIWSIRRGYGADCDTSDLEVIDWLEDHIKLIKWK